MADKVFVRIFIPTYYLFGKWAVTQYKVGEDVDSSTCSHKYNFALQK